jgi:hypothetical protein
MIVQPPDLGRWLINKDGIPVNLRGTTIATTALLTLALAACGGGGGGSTPSGGGGGVPPAGPPKSVSGDMLALAPNRGWNYQTPSGGGITVSVYVNPTKTSTGLTILASSAVLGYVPTVLTSRSYAEANISGGLTFSSLGDGYHVYQEISAGSLASVPGSPLLVGASLTAGATSSPYPGVQTSVLNVGPQPGESACGTTVDGAAIQYTIAGNGSWTISVVPGCGITQFTSASGSVFTLQSVGTYAIGDLAKARKVESANAMTTVLSLLGRGRQDFPGAALIK